MVRVVFRESLISIPHFLFTSFSLISADIKRPMSWNLLQCILLQKQVQSSQFLFQSFLRSLVLVFFYCSCKNICNPYANDFRDKLWTKGLRKCNSSYYATITFTYFFAVTIQVALGKTRPWSSWKSENFIIKASKISSFNSLGEFFNISVTTGLIVK